MCCQNLPLKLICLTCFFIMAVDSVVLYQTMSQLEDIKSKVIPDIFSNCYEPQLAMRIIFTCYAINAAALCFLLTLALCYLTEDRIEWVAMKLFTYTYIIFGPLMLIFCIFGFIFIKGLLFQCQPTYITTSVNFMDVFILFGCTAFSGIITLFYSMHQTVEQAQFALRDEKSIIYRIFLDYLGYRRRKQQRQEQQSLRSNSNTSSNEGSASQPRSYQSIDDQEQQQQQHSIQSPNRRRRLGPINSYIPSEENQIENAGSEERRKQESREDPSLQNEPSTSFSERDTRATLNNQL